MKHVSLAEVKDNFSKYLRQAGRERIVITKHGKPAGVLIGFDTEDDWFEYKLENDPRFLQRIARARRNLSEGKGIPWNEVKKEGEVERKGASRKRNKKEDK